MIFDPDKQGFETKDLTTQDMNSDAEQIGLT